DVRAERADVDGPVGRDDDAYDGALALARVAQLRPHGVEHRALVPDAEPVAVTGHLERLGAHLEQLDAHAARRRVGDHVGAAVLQAQRHPRGLLDVDGLRGGDRPRLRAHEAPCGARAGGDGSTLAEARGLRIGDAPDSDPGTPVWDHGPDPSSILREETTMSK